MNEHAAKSIDNWSVYKGTPPGFIEEVYLLEPIADENSSTLAILTNSDLSLGTSVRWNLNELPHLTMEKHRR